MCEGKTEYGLLLGLLETWDHDLEGDGKLPSAALGVVGAEGIGGTGSAQWALDLLNVGYDVVLFLDSDEPNANQMVPKVESAGGKVVQWLGGVCTERALCDQLDAEGLTMFIAAAVEASDDRDSAVASFGALLQGRGAPKTEAPLDVRSWLAADMSLEDAREAVALVAKTKGWFKNVDRGRLLAKIVLSRPELRTGTVAQTIAQLREHVYQRTQPIVVRQDPLDEAAATDEPTA